LAAYTTSLGYFAESCSKVYVGDIEQTDLLQFAAFLRDDKELLPLFSKVTAAYAPWRSLRQMERQACAKGM